MVGLVASPETEDIKSVALFVVTYKTGAAVARQIHRLQGDWTHQYTNILSDNFNFEVITFRS